MKETQQVTSVKPPLLGAGHSHSPLISTTNNPSHDQICLHHFVRSKRHPIS